MRVNMRHAKLWKIFLDVNYEDWMAKAGIAAISDGLWHNNRIDTIRRSHLHAQRLARHLGDINAQIQARGGRIHLAGYGAQHCPGRQRAKVS